MRWLGLRTEHEQELLRAARNGDDGAITQLMGELLPFIHRKAFACASSSTLDAEDLAQEGLIGFLSAVRTFREDGNARFSTYACTCILNSMRSAMRKDAKSGAVPQSAVISIEDAAELFPAADDPQDIIVGQDAAQQFWDSVDKRLSRREQQVLRLYIGGDSYAVIAQKLSLRDAKSVDNTLQRIRKKLKSFS